ATATFTASPSYTPTKDVFAETVAARTKTANAVAKFTATPSSTFTPTPTPNLTATTVFATLQAQATVIAQTLNAESTKYPPSPTVGATATLTPPTAVAEVATSVAFVVRDESGAILGNGEVRLYAPQKMNLDDTSEIKVEIEVKAPAPAVGSTLNPAPSSTPV